MATSRLSVSSESYYCYISQISFRFLETETLLTIHNVQVKRLAIRLGKLALPTCFSIECQNESEPQVLFGAKTWLGWNFPGLFKKLMQDV